MSNAYPLYRRINSKLGEHITALNIEYRINPDCHMHVMQVIMMNLISLGSLDCSVHYMYAVLKLALIEHTLHTCMRLTLLLSADSKCNNELYSCKLRREVSKLGVFGASATALIN